MAVLALPIVLLAACGRDEPPARARRPSALLFTPKIQGSLVVDTSGTEDTERLVMVAPVAGDSVAKFYRNSLARTNWQLSNDRSDGGVIDLQATGGPFGSSTLWIHIERQDSLSARYTLIATTPPMPAPDTAAGPTPERPR